MAGEGAFSIRELPDRVRKRVLDKWRYELWDQHDSEQLTEDFKEILQQRGMVDPELYWSLSYCQGDGVAWKGSLDLHDFFKWIFSGDEHARPFVKDAKPVYVLEDYVSVHIGNEYGRHYWNAMQVDIEVVGETIDLVPQRYREQVRGSYQERRHAFEEWEKQKRVVDAQRNQPIYKWQRRREGLPKGPKEWRPAAPPEPPTPLDIPYPPPPEPHEPARITRLLNKAEQLEANVEPLIGQLRGLVEHWAQVTSRYLEKLGYDEIEYRSTDEYVMEFLENNEYLFDEDGEEV